MTNSLSSPQQDKLVVERHPAEIPLLILVILASISIWILMAVSMVGIVYAVMIGAFFFLGHIGFVAYLRGSAVKIGPDQFSELYSRVVTLSNRVGLNTVPEVYLMQAGGLLNALATKMFRTKIVVLYSDLLDACGDNTSARDMIIGHELGHLKAGHLNFLWFILPGLFIPFLGSVYSQVREYTCDKYGAALCGDLSGALTGLAILSAGGKFGPQVNLREYVNQGRLLNTGVMTLGKLLASHPPLSSRALALDATLSDTPIPRTRGQMTLAALFVSAFIGLIVGVYFITDVVEKFSETIEERLALVEPETQVQFDLTKVVSDSQIEKIPSELKQVASLFEEIRKSTDSYPSADTTTLSKLWRMYRTEEPEPMDPFDGNSYGYYIEGNSYIIWSAGPDRESNTDDDITYSTFETE